MSNDNRLQSLSGAAGADRDLQGQKEHSIAGTQVLWGSASAWT